MAISAKDVKNLRERTGMGMMECKAALTETGGDFDAAVDLLRAKAKGKMDERTDREASEGMVVVASAEDGSAVAMIELSAETDFTARNDDFVAAAQKIAQIVLAGNDGAAEANDEITKLVDDVRLTTKENISMRRAFKMSGGTLGSYVHHNNKIGVILQAEGEIEADLRTGICQHVAGNVPTPQAVDESGLDADLVAQEKAAAQAEAEASGKPAEIAEKIATGKLRKFIQENTLLGQKYVRDETGKTIKEVLPKGATVQSFVRFELGS